MVPKISSSSCKQEKHKDVGIKQGKEEKPKGLTSSNSSNLDMVFSSRVDCENDEVFKEKENERKKSFSWPLLQFL